MAIAGKRVEVKITQTNDIGDLLNSINSVQIKGEADFFTSVKVAQLSLKHRQNKSQRQRIIIFVGHPLDSFEENDFVDLGRRLNRNSVAIDIVNFANPQNVAKLEALVTAAENGNGCHFLDVPLGIANILDVMIASPIINEGMEGGVMPGVEGGGGAGAPGAVQHAEFGGIDPNLDPELAMAMRISLEEQRAQQVHEAG